MIAITIKGNPNGISSAVIDTLTVSSSGSVKLRDRVKLQVKLKVVIP